MASQFWSSLVHGIPNFDSPIIRTSQEDWAILLIEEWVTSQLVDWASVTSVCGQILLGVGHGALVNCCVLSRSEIVHVLFTVCWEVNGKTTSADESHSTAFLLNLSSGVDVLLVRVSLTLELHELGVLKTLSQGPLNDLTITRDRDQ